MKVYLQPENAVDKAVLLSNELMLTSSSGDRYVLIKEIASELDSSRAPTSLITYYSDKPIRRKQLLRQLQRLVEETLAKHQKLMYALYKEESPGQLSYYILLENDNEASRQTIHSLLFEDPLEDLRRYCGRSVFYLFYPKDKEHLLTEMNAVKLYP